jgi:hypothetical protein
MAASRRLPRAGPRCIFLDLNFGLATAAAALAVSVAPFRPKDIQSAFASQ